MYSQRLAQIILIVIVKSNLHYIQQQIDKYQQIDLILTNERYKQGKFILLHQNIQTQQFKKVQERFQLSKYNQYCFILQNSSNIFFINTFKQTYLGINTLNSSSFVIFDLQCKKISQFHNINIKSIICDHNVCLDNQIYFLSYDGKILKCNQNFNQSQCIFLLQINQTITGTTLRINHQKQIIISTKNQILFYNQKGECLKNISLGKYQNILQFKDHHPSPLILMDSGWIYLLDIKNYKIITSKFPYIKNLNYLYIYNVYDPIIYGFTDSSIYIFEIKSSDKSVQIKQKRFITEIENISKDKIQIFQGIIYIQNKIINKKSNTQYIFDQCGKDVFFKFLKIKNKNILLLIKCCKNDKECSTKILKQSVTGSASISYPFFISFLILMMFLFIMMKLIKSLKRKSDIETDLNLQKISQRKKNR